METKHTPGPWHLGVRQAEAIVYDTKGWAVCNCTVYHGKHDTEPKHNARLIATAPELLAALQAICSTYRTFRNVPVDEQQWTSFDDDALEAGFAAIAKATNE